MLSDLNNSYTETISLKFFFIPRMGAEKRKSSRNKIKVIKIQENLIVLHYGPFENSKYGFFLFNLKKVMAII